VPIRSRGARPFLFRSCAADPAAIASWPMRFSSKHVSLRTKYSSGSPKLFQKNAKIQSSRATRACALPGHRAPCFFKKFFRRSAALSRRARRA
jgi:hypothetical protein